MLVKVVDASAIAVLFDEPQAQMVAGKLSNSKLLAPTLLQFEIASVTLKKINLYPEQRNSILNAYNLLGFLKIELCEVEHQKVIQLAEQSYLTTYDASYLWLALSLSAELVTLDKELLKIAVKLESIK